MKTIHLQDVKSVKAEDVKPGMIIAEGIVVGSHKQESGGKRRDIWFIETAADGHMAWAYAGQMVQVYGVLSEGMTDGLLKTYKAS